MTEKRRRKMGGERSGSATKTSREEDEDGEEGNGEEGGEEALARLGPHGAAVSAACLVRPRLLTGAD